MAHLVLVRAVDIVTVTHYSEFAASVVMALLDVVLFVIFVYAFARCRKGAFLLLAAGTIAFVYMNFVSACMSMFAITHMRLFSSVTMKLFFAIYSVIGPVGGILWFLGAVLLVRFTLRLYASRQT